MRGSRGEEERHGFNAEVTASGDAVLQLSTVSSPEGPCELTNPQVAKTLTLQAVRGNIDILVRGFPSVPAEVPSEGGDF